ncbi:hypothetical protein [Pseudomonas sp. GOM6]|uniref:hypothetical protein n=1 Tax=Pseudomonas sp. GOM6 TaxID=3036944 RepID=UPI00240A03BE|nr:hypothetical protein [Pseudomonas sp. GOM6]MDG1580896.1 hypothetical protein [Pseudomonas sp. GOM6]
MTQDSNAPENVQSESPVHGEVVVIPLSHFIGSGRLPWLIIGRVPNDDDDTGYLVLADDESQAQETFKDQLHDDAGNDEEERANIAEKYDSDTFITTSQLLT